MLPFGFFVVICHFIRKVKLNINITNQSSVLTVPQTVKTKKTKFPTVLISMALPIVSSSISSNAVLLQRNCNFFNISLANAVKASLYLDKTVAQSSTERVLAKVPETKSTNVHLKDLE